MAAGSGEASSWLADSRLPMSSGGGRGEGALGASSLRALAQPEGSWVHLLIPSPWGVGFQHLNLGGHEHSDHST